MPTISKAKNSKSVKTTIKVVDKTIKDKKDTKEAPRDRVAREDNGSILYSGYSNI